MQKDFITATPDTGGGNGTINVTASKNTSSEKKYEFNYFWGGGNKNCKYQSKERNF